MATDPVCGMEVKERNAEAQSGYEGHTYYFCSQDCKREFEQSPDLYIGEDEEEEIVD